MDECSELPERDPLGTDQHVPGAKLDDGKVDLTLLMDFGNALMAVARVGMYGAQKYSRSGWLAVPDGFFRYTKALFRHLFGLGPLDPIPNVPDELIHDAQVAWNSLARLELKIRETM